MSLFRLARRPDRWSLTPGCFKNARICRVRWDVMALPALQKFEQQIGRQIRLLELSKNIIERKIERQIRLFEKSATASARRSKRRSGNSRPNGASGSTTRCASSAPGLNGRCRSAP